MHEAEVCLSGQYLKFKDGTIPFKPFSYQRKCGFFSDKKEHKHYK